MATPGQSGSSFVGPPAPPAASFNPTFVGPPAPPSVSYKPEAGFTFGSGSSSSISSSYKPVSITYQPPPTSASFSTRAPSSIGSSVNVSFGPTRQSNQSWARAVLAPSAYSAKPISMPPIKFNDTTYIDSRLQGRVSQASREASETITSAAENRTVQTPGLFKYLAPVTPVSGPSVFDRNAYLSGQYQNNVNSAINSFEAGNNRVASASVTIPPPEFAKAPSGMSLEELGLAMELRQQGQQGISSALTPFDLVADTAVSEVLDMPEVQRGIEAAFDAAPTAAGIGITAAALLSPSIALRKATKLGPAFYADVASRLNSKMGDRFFSFYSNFGGYEARKLGKQFLDFKSSGGFGSRGASLIDVTTPKNLYIEAYGGDRKLFESVLAKKRAYREQNPGLLFTQDLREESLNSGVFVHDMHPLDMANISPNQTTYGYFDSAERDIVLNRILNFEQKIKPHSEALASTLTHETTHSLQIARDYSPLNPKARGLDLRDIRKNTPYRDRIFEIEARFSEIERLKALGKPIPERLAKDIKDYPWTAKYLAPGILSATAMVGASSASAEEVQPQFRIQFTPTVPVEFPSYAPQIDMASPRPLETAMAPKPEYSQSQNTDILKFVRPVTGEPGVFEIDRNAYYRSLYPSDEAYAKAIESANVFRRERYLPEITTSRFSQSTNPFSSERDVTLGVPLRILNSPDDSSFTRVPTFNRVGTMDMVGRQEGIILAPADPRSQIAARNETFISPNAYVTDVSEALFNGYFPKTAGSVGYPNAPTPEQFAAAILLHELSHSIWVPSMTASDTLESEFVRAAGRPTNPNAAVYPLSKAAEVTPPVDAIQREYIKQTGGQRIETKEQYQSFMKKYDNLTPAQINELNAPFEFKRALQYRKEAGPKAVDPVFQDFIPGSIGFTPRTRPVYA